MTSIPDLVAPAEPKPRELPYAPPIITSEEVQALNRAQRRRMARWGGLRPRFASFRCPWPISEPHYEQYRNNAVNKWLDDEAKHGWDLKGKVAVDVTRRAPATDYSGDWAIPLPGYVEIPVAAMFQKRKVEARVFEIPVAV